MCKVVCRLSRVPLRCLYTLGVMLRYFDFDEMLNSEESQEIMTEYNRLNESDEWLESRIAERRRRSNESHPQILREYVFACLLYFAKCRRLELSLKALAAIGQFWGLSMTIWMPFVSAVLLQDKWLPDGWNFRQMPS
jgi:hypothetical protein